MFPSSGYDKVSSNIGKEECLSPASANGYYNIPGREDVLYIAAALDQEEKLHIGGDMMVGINGALSTIV